MNERQKTKDIDPFPPPPCEINLNNLHMVVKIAMFLCFWEVHEEAPAWPKGAHATRQKNAERQGRRKKLFALLDRFACPCRTHALPVMDLQNP